MEGEQMPCCAAWEELDQHSAKLQHLKFSFFKLQKEQFFLQEHSTLLGSFPSRGYKIRSWVSARQSHAKAKPCSGGMPSRQESFQGVRYNLRRRGVPTFSQLCCAFCPACHKYNFWSIKPVCEIRLVTGLPGKAAHKQAFFTSLL